MTDYYKKWQQTLWLEMITEKKENKDTKTKPQTTAGSIMGKHEYSKVRYCKITQICKQI